MMMMRNDDDGDDNYNTADDDNNNDDKKGMPDPGWRSCLVVASPSLGSTHLAMHCTMCTLCSKMTLYQIQSHNLECKIRFFG